MTLATGINEQKRDDIAKGLSKLLAESYILYLKTHKYHWNVTGPWFQSLHAMFEEQYTALAEAVDVIAERVRVLGVKAPGSFAEFSQVSGVKEDTGLDATAEQMITNLLADNECLARTAKDVLVAVQGANDEGTASLMGTRIEYHEKTAWMLKSLSLK